jgi:hypothetical protein
MPQSREKQLTLQAAELPVTLHGAGLTLKL